MNRGPMPICGHCGVIAPTEVDECDGCKAALTLGSQPTVSDRPDGAFWIQVRAQFKCRHCDKRSPVNHVDVDGTFLCLHCQTEQGADAGIWAQGLKFCHEVIDLAGPHPEGRHPSGDVSIAERNKWADIGVSRTRARMEMSETIIGNGVRLRSLFVDARVGCPVCDKCKTPLEVVVEQPGKLKARCPRCNDNASYEVHEQAIRMNPAFRGALGDDHRSDKQSAKVGSSEPGAPVAIVCPGCGAALDLEAEDHFVTCKYCSTPSKIPSRLRSQLFQQGVTIEPFWLLFKGPSKARSKLEKQAIAEQNKAEKKQRQQADRERSQRPQSVHPSGRPLSKAEKTKRAQLLSGAALVVGALMISVLYHYIVG